MHLKVFSVLLFLVWLSAETALKAQRCAQVTIMHSAHLYIYNKWYLTENTLNFCIFKINFNLNCQKKTNDK